MLTKRLFAFFALFMSGYSLYAQLDTIHWVPPMHARGEYGPQFLYISTPEPLPFPVEIRDGQGGIIQTLVISNAQPQRFDLAGSPDNTMLQVPETNLANSLIGKGLVLVGPQKFYVNFRAHSSSLYQACDLTCKGRAALGQTFRIAHLIQGANDIGRSNFIGIMATEDNTTVRLSDYDSSVRFRIDGSDQIVAAPFTKTLNAGESIVFAQYIYNSASFQPPNGLIGSLLTSDKPIAVNVGSWTGGPSNSGNDIGVDQIVPFELVGEEYILCKGNGGTVLEFPIVVAHENGTVVKINGSPTPSATLNAGQWLQVTSNQFSSSGNIYIECSKPAFVYQMVGGVPSGDDEKRTAGLIFVPPISCSIPNAVDNIYQPNRIGDVRYDGGLMVVAMRDSVVTLRVNGNITTLGTPGAVSGNPDFVTYRNLTVFSDNNPPETASIVAEGAVQVAYFGRNGAAGFGGFYSGFSKTIKPTLDLSLVGDGVCPDTLVATGRFDGVQWYFADSLLQYGPDSFFVAYAPGQYIARGYLGVCRKNDFTQDTVEAVFQSPVFPYTIQEPRCFGEPTGQVLFGTPSGGIAPYQYSVNNGASFGDNPTIGNIAAGDYKLVVRDSTGCYNRPLEIQVGQPDSLGITLEAINLREPVKVGESVRLAATPNRTILFADWMPADTTGCDNCLTQTVYPTETMWYEITVTDSMGCEAADRIQIIIEPNVYAPNVFTPGSTEGNDRFLLFSKEALPVNWLRIYDRWGALVFEKKNIVTNDFGEGWDGSFKNKDLSPAVFVFMAEIEYFPGRRKVIQGDLTLIR